MNTSLFLKASFVAIPGSLGAFSPVFAQQQPHIILIMSDQHRGDAMNCMGNTSVITPNLDALASEGTLFMNGYSSAPSSTPARAGLLTGLSPWHHGMLGYGRVGKSIVMKCPECCAIFITIHSASARCTGSRKKHFTASMALW